jgi:Nucleotidyl transferase AbiEii toxin, Type IV TA system
VDFFAEIRRQTIIALFADDRLMEQLVLKGGNALNLIYGLSPRTSLDLDFSLEGDFEDLEDTERRILGSLKDRFDSAGYEVFDESFQAKPKLEGPDERPWWGGYELRFKLLPKRRRAAVQTNLDKMRIRATVVGPGQQRTFSVDFSKHEFTAPKQERDLEHYSIFVYTPAMIAIEKLRAICQQMPAYRIRGHPVARARDFFDIYLVVTKENLDLATSESCELAQNIFEAKRVPLRLLAGIREQREFHRPDWAAVEASVPGRIEPYDFYFDFVAKQVDRLKALWEE